MSGAVERIVLLLRVGTDPVLYLSSAFGPFPVPANALDAGQEIYHGLGAVEAFPAVQQLLNGVADRGSFTLSGVPAEIAALAEVDAPSVQGAAVNIGLVFLDAAWAIVGQVFWLWDGVADKLTAAKAMDGKGNESHHITLSVGTAHAARSRPQFAMWTDAQHQRRRPGDLFLNQVPTEEKEKRWPI